jgi:putative peptidoglycan lipid II flippase
MPTAERETELPAASPMAVPESVAPEPIGPDPGEAQLPDATGRGSFLVAAGILVARLFGLVRERVFAYYFGNSVAAGAFKAAFRIPNFLQNLFGEGVLSASFIPVYANLIARGDRDEADHVASAVFAWLALVTSLLVAAGVLLAPQMISIIAPGFHGESRALTIQLVRIFFPGTGVLVLSAWCLGILNSHRKFFLSYAAPVIWSSAQIVALVGWGNRVDSDRLALYVAVGAAVGSALQFLVQLPRVMHILRRFRPVLVARKASTRTVFRNFLPVLLGRGVVQVSAFVDTAYASLISERAVSALAYAQMIYLLPVSLFGMAVSAAELPAMSQAIGTVEEVSAKLRNRVDDGLARIAYFVIPSAAALLCLGDVIGAALLQTGRFHAGDSRFLWYLLIGATVGLLATTMGRLYASTFYALRDARTPLYFAVLRVALTAVLAYWSAVKLPGQLGVPRELGAVGITGTTGLAAWLEYLLLRRSLGKRIGDTGLGASRLIRLWGAAALGVAVGLGIKAALVRVYGSVASTMEWGAGFLPFPALHPVAVGLLVLVPFVAVYFALTVLLRIPQANAVLRRIGLRR